MVDAGRPQRGPHARGDVERDWRAAYHRYAKVKCKRPRKPRDRPAT